MCCDVMWLDTYVTPCFCHVILVNQKMTFAFQFSVCLDMVSIYLAYAFLILRRLSASVYHHVLISRIILFLGDLPLLEFNLRSCLGWI
jgi:hypothetical protein